MTYVVVRHKVEDYAEWKPVFDEHEATRKAVGGKGYLILRNSDDPSELVVLTEFDNISNAKEWAGSPGLHEAMAKAGVADKPDIYFCETADGKIS